MIKGLETNSILERWIFDCECTLTNENEDNINKNSLKLEKTMKEITSEIQAIIRQITACVTFLPLLNESCSFDILIYADTDTFVPILWEDSDPCIIANGEDVKLRSFDTKVRVIKF